MAKWLLLLCLSACMSLATAKEAAPAADDPVIEARMLRITSDLRCLVCQNQTIADSHADLASDLRKEVREMLRAGKTDQQVVDFMTARYGDFVLYRPPFKSTTALLWIGPELMSVLGVAILALVLWRRSKLPQDRFEPDEEEAADAAAPATDAGKSST